jgi:hypothetical protein
MDIFTIMNNGVFPCMIMNVLDNIVIYLWTKFSLVSQLQVCQKEGGKQLKLHFYTNQKCSINLSRQWMSISNAAISSS